MISSVLITGGSGYFGQAMTRYLMHDVSIERICVYSRGEYAQALMRENIPDPQSRIRYFIGDVRDGARLRQAMDGCDTVIHAAALKRIEVIEYNPGEAVKTNILGTMNVIDAATAAGVKRVIYLSTDKACQPRNAYGATKLSAEKLILAANNARGQHGPLFNATRYGNIAGSTGSVIPTWRMHLQAGLGPIYITDPEATRFWMTLDEALDLVIEAALREVGGHLIVPHLPAYSLFDLAIAMNVPRPFHVTGLRQGEKLHERMLEDGPDSSEVQRLTVDELKEKLRSI